MPKEGPSIHAPDRQGPITGRRSVIFMAACPRALGVYRSLRNDALAGQWACFSCLQRVVEAYSSYNIAPALVLRDLNLFFPCVTFFLSRFVFPSSILPRGASLLSTDCQNYSVLNEPPATRLSYIRLCCRYRPPRAVIAVSFRSDDPPPPVAATETAETASPTLEFLGRVIAKFRTRSRNQTPSWLLAIGRKP